MNDFIEIYDNALSKELCKEIIIQAEKARLYKNPRHKSIQDDYTVMIHHYLKENTYIDLMNIIHKAYIDYKEKYWILDKTASLTPPCIKYHLVKPGGGYHVYHCENSGFLSKERVLVYHICLNTCDDEGELDFLYYKKKLFPKIGRLIVFPASFTHVHRGNPMKTKDKHYVTGWYEYASTGKIGENIKYYKEK
tara:strand:- start:3578 stop:4156 length:579 start_codon:yes stop_codon:yes gene_type:complete